MGAWAERGTGGAVKGQRKGFLFAREDESGEGGRSKGKSEEG